jgi:hypothetical protein
MHRVYWLAGTAVSIEADCCTWRGHFTSSDVAGQPIYLFHHRLDCATVPAMAIATVLVLIEAFLRIKVTDR